MLCFGMLPPAFAMGIWNGMDLDIQCSDMAGYLYIGNCVVLFLDILSYINNFPPSAPPAFGRSKIAIITCQFPQPPDN